VEDSLRASLVEGHVEAVVLGGGHGAVAKFLVEHAAADGDRVGPRGTGGLLRPGGRLVYAVCSLQPEEGAPRVARLLAQGGWRLDPVAPEELADVPEARTVEGYMRTHPGMWAEHGGMDGFFAARLIWLGD
ncbi:MAG: hypothetical protein JOY66_14340, partial [Acetobacteraceae bacterium]|nr:hypothetical protein [Acetobacteraceae bacterium]